MYTGECNGCGICCAPTIKGRPYVCEHLEVLGALGTEGATRCRVHSSRKMGMLIKQYPADGPGEPNISRCLPTYPQQQDAIPKECSYVWVNQENALVQPKWFEGYEPTRDESEIEP